MNLCDVFQKHEQKTGDKSFQLSFVLMNTNTFPFLLKLDT